MVPIFLGHHIYIMPLQYSDYTSALHSPSEMLRLEDAKKFWNGKRESSASHSQPFSAFLPGKRKVHNPWNVRPVSVYNTEISSRASSCLSTVHASVCVWVWGGGVVHIQSFRSVTLHSVSPPITHVFHMSKIKHRGSL